MKKVEIKNYKKVVLEIGCGGGYFLKHYNNQFDNGSLYLIGVEISKRFYNKALKRIKNFKNKNCSIFLGDIREKLKDLNGIKFDEVHINFPDPWFKYKHKKRILCRPSFLNNLSGYLKKDGYISIVTDIFDLCVRIITGVNKLNSSQACASFGCTIPAAQGCGRVIFLQRSNGLQDLETQ